MAKRNFQKLALPIAEKLTSEGQVTEGEFEKTELQNINGKDVNVFIFKGDDGLRRRVLGTTLLEKYMAMVKPGQYVRITLGKEEKGSKGRAYKTYTVEVA